MDTLLKSFMEQAENAGLSEGEYLKTCNALKKTFEMVNSADNKETPFDMEFKLEFKCKNGYEFYLNITKAIRVSGPFANRIQYTLRVSKDCTIIKEQIDAKCSVQKMSSIIKNVGFTYMFDTFTITNSISSNEYNVKKIMEYLNDKYNHYNNLPQDDEHDREYEFVCKNEYAFFIDGIFHRCYEESFNN